MGSTIRIIGSPLPGSTCGPSNDRPDGYRNIHVGVQRGKEVEQLVRGDAATATFELPVDVRNGRLAGPYVQGRGDERFVYLSWGEVDGQDFTMFRRAKLHVSHLDVAEVDGHTIEGRLSLVDGRGHPLCASVRPPVIEWTVLP